jgi:CRISPR-associated protein Cmr5
MTTPTQGRDVPNRRRTLEQERGARAWQYIGEVKATEYQKEYRSLARGLNAMIQINGLGQTLAFFKAKGNKRKNGQPVPNEHKHLFEQLSRWVSKQILQQESPDLLTWAVRDASTEQYRQATAECMAFGLWLRRFAEAELEAGDGD